MAARVLPAKLPVLVRNVERLAVRCEDILGERSNFRGQDWKIIKVSR